MLYLVPKKTGVILLSTRGPGPLTRHLAELGIRRPRATLDQVNACSWGASLRGDNALRVIADATRRPQLTERITWARAFVVLFEAAMNHARRKRALAPIARALNGAGVSVAAYRVPLGKPGPVPLFDAITKIRFTDPRPPGRGEQTE
jgi:hypothetical protein